MAKFNKSPISRYNKAKELRAEGEFAAAAFEFNQSLGEQSQVKDSYFQIGDIMRILGNEPKAAEYYRKAVALDPNDISIRMVYAKILDNLGEEEAAVNEYNFILSKSSDNKDVLYALENIYKKKYEDNPNDADLCTNLGAILQKQNKYEEALAYYKKSEQLNPSNVNTRINVGTLYQQKGDYKTAIIAYDSVLIVEPDNINANIYKAQCKSALGDEKTAQEIYKKVLALDPGNEVILSEMFNSVKSTMTTAEFIDYVNKNSFGINSFNILYDYALDLHKQGKYDDAITIYNALLPKDITGEVYINLAIAETQQEKYMEALKTLSTAQSKFPDNKLISKSIAEINDTLKNQQLASAAEYFNNKDYAHAIAEYMKIIPPTSDTMLAIASAYQHMNDNTNAIIYYKKAFELNPTSSELAYYIAALYADEEDWESAEAYSQKSLLLNKNNNDAIALLKEIKTQNNSKLLETAIALFDAQDYEQSLPLLNQVISTDANNSYALYYRAMIFDSQEKYQDAIKDYKNAININPQDLKIINYNLAVDYDNLEKYKEAYTYYDKYANAEVPEDEYKTYAIDRAKELKTYVEQSTKPVSDKK